MLSSINFLNPAMPAIDAQNVTAFGRTFLYLKLELIISREDCFEKNLECIDLTNAIGKVKRFAISAKSR